MARQNERSPIAVNWLDYVAYELYDPLRHKALTSRYFLFAAISLL